MKIKLIPINHGFGIECHLLKNNIRERETNCNFEEFIVNYRHTILIFEFNLYDSHFSYQILERSCDPKRNLLNQNMIADPSLCSIDRLQFHLFENFGCL